MTASVFVDTNVLLVKATQKWPSRRDDVRAEVRFCLGVPRPSTRPCSKVPGRFKSVSNSLSGTPCALVVANLQVGSSPKTES
jgi:hypothetical protein